MKVLFLDSSLPALLSALALVQRSSKNRVQVLDHSRASDGQLIWPFYSNELSPEHMEWIRQMSRTANRMHGELVLPECNYLFRIDVFMHLKRYATVEFLTDAPALSGNTCTFENGYLGSLVRQNSCVSDACWIAEAVAGFETLDILPIKKFLAARFF